MIPIIFPLFSQSENHLSTLQASFLTKKIAVNGALVTLHIWDTVSIRIVIFTVILIRPFTVVHLLWCIYYGASYTIAHDRCYPAM